MRELTSPQQQILWFIQEWAKATSATPTRAEISRQLGFRSSNSAEEHLKALAKKGVLELQPGAARGIRLNQEMGLLVVGRVAACSPLRRSISRFAVKLIRHCSRRARITCSRYRA